MGSLLMAVGALLSFWGGHRTERPCDGSPAAVELNDGGSDESDLLREELRARWVDIGMMVAGTMLVGLVGSLLMAVLISWPDSQEAVSVWWGLPELELPDLPWVEIALTAVGLPTTLVIAVAVGPQAPEHSSGTRVPVSEVVRAEFVAGLATTTAVLSSIALWFFATCVPRTPGGLLLALLLVLAALYCACLAGLGGPSHRQRLRNVEELRRLRDRSGWVDGGPLPSWGRVLGSCTLLALCPGSAVALALLVRLWALGEAAQGWLFAVILGGVTAMVSFAAWGSWFVWLAAWISRAGHDSIATLQKKSPWRVLHVLVILLWGMAAMPGLIFLAQVSRLTWGLTTVDLSIAVFISVAPLLGVWLLRRTAVSAPPLRRGVLRERRRLVRQVISAERRVERITHA